MNNCVYLHLTKDKKVFYVGIGTLDRAYSKSGRTRFWKRVVDKHGYTVQIVRRNLSREDACELEILLIEGFGRRDLRKGYLVNMTSGGDSPKVLSIRTEEYCKNISIAKLGNKNPMFGKKSTRAKKILKLDLNGTFIAEYSNSYLAAKSVNGQATKVIACCKGTRKTHMKFKFKYKN